MADYYAVLNRTLSGFGNANAQLRTKLYERARLTIQSQLSNRNPPLDEGAMLAEMQKLEQAIADIESGYGDEVPTGEIAQAEKPKEVEPTEPDTESEPAISETAETETEPTPEPEAAVESEAIEDEVPEVAPEEVVQEDEALEVSPEEVVEEPEPELEEKAELEKSDNAEVEHAADAASSAPEKEPNAEAEVESSGEEPEVQPEIESDQVTEDEVPAPADEPREDTVEADAKPADASPDEDPLSAAITEFSESEIERKSGMPLDAEPIPDVTDILEAKFLKDVVGAVEEPVPDKTPHALEPEEEPDYSDPAASEDTGLPAIDFDAAEDDENLVIPPAIDPRKKARGSVGRYLAQFAALLVLIAGLATAWMYRSDIATSLGFAELFNDPTRPKPVKTISIKPEPEQPETKTEVKPEVAPEPKPDGEVVAKPEAEGEQPTVPEPKLEQRLTESGEESNPEQPLEPILPTETEQGETPTPTVDATPKIDEANGTQTAILYEEGADAQSSGLDAGSVTWSVVNEAPAEGQAEEPAIRAQIEIPDRKTVLIMTIKRNADPALTASHLIELIFAVPDDFSGGAINTINRFVLKDTEQGRGETLNAVPVKISDGIFLIALDNLPDAKQKNEVLLKTKDWIDIPLQYRTGRRALVTIEKGTTGAKVFKEVFDAWEAAATPTAPAN